MPAVGPVLLSASLRDAAGLKAVLDLVDKEYSQDAGERWCTPPAALSCGLLALLADTRLQPGLFHF